MTSVKTIKGINEDAWSSFKSIAAKNNMKMGKLFEEMLDRYKQDSKRFWDEILNGEKILSDKEAEDIEKSIKKLRKEKGFRELKWS